MFDHLDEMVVRRGCLKCLNWEKEVNKLREQRRLLKDAVIVLKSGMGGHDHWDQTMKRGAGCPICIRQRKAADAAMKLLEECDEIDSEQP
jgi:transposase